VRSYSLLNMNSDCAGENHFHHGKNRSIALARENLYNEINILHHRRIRDASIYRKYAMSTVGRGIIFLSCTYQIAKFISFDMSLRGLLPPFFLFPFAESTEF